jgi:Flp pilus assembly protein TadG
MTVRTKRAFVAFRDLLRSRRFAADQRGVSAVEFALVLPFMLTLFLGGMQLSDAIGIDRKVTLTARTVADLVARVSVIDVTGVDSVLNAGTAVMSPYADSGGNASKLMARVSMIKIDAQSNVSVQWSRAKNGSPLSGAVDVPAQFLIPNSYLILGEATYNYTPPIGYVLTGTLHLNDRIFMRPRLSETVTCNGC